MTDPKIGGRPEERDETGEKLKSSVEQGPKILTQEDVLLLLQETTWQEGGGTPQVNHFIQKLSELAKTENREQVMKWQTGTEIHVLPNSNPTEVYSKFLEDDKRGE